MYSSAPQSPAVAGRASPPGTAPAPHTTVMVSSCTTVRPSALRLVLHTPSPTMCAAYSTADASVSASPVPTARPCSDSTPRPSVASATAVQTVGPMRARSRTAPSSGVNTTYMPVTKPDTEAEVDCRPTVCSTWAPP
jgi:hypothetical protein